MERDVRAVQSQFNKFCCGTIAKDLNAFSPHDGLFTRNNASEVLRRYTATEPHSATLNPSANHIRLPLITRADSRQYIKAKTFELRVLCSHSFLCLIRVRYHNKCITINRRNLLISDWFKRIEKIIISNLIHFM